MTKAEYWTAELGEPVEILPREWESGTDYIVRVGGHTVDVVDSLEDAEKILTRIFMLTSRD